MRAPLAPILLKKESVPQRERTIEDVLNAFVGAHDKKDPLTTTSCISRCLNINSHHVSRPVVEDILQEMMMFVSFASNNSNKAAAPLLPNKTILPQQSLDLKRYVVQAFATSHSAKELPKLILAYVTSLQQQRQRQRLQCQSHRHHFTPTVVVVVVLQKLVEFIGRCNFPGVVVVTPRQRSCLQMAFRRLLTATTTKDIRQQYHHSSLIRQQQCHHHYQREDDGRREESSLSKHSSIPLAGIQLRAPSTSAATATNMEEAAKMIVHHLRILKKVDIGSIYQERHRMVQLVMESNKTTATFVELMQSLESVEFTSASPISPRIG